MKINKSSVVRESDRKAAMFRGLLAEAQCDLLRALAGNTEINLDKTRAKVRELSERFQANRRDVIASVSGHMHASTVFA